MAKDRTKIGVVAPGCRIEPSTMERIEGLVNEIYPDGRVEIMVHPQCYLSAGHFAGDDAARAEAFVEMANDDSIQAVWFARGGYGACRIVEAALPRLGPAARCKAYMGYSDAGMLLAGLYANGFDRVAHGPMPQDVLRDGGEAAVARALAWLVDGEREALEPSVGGGPPAVAFNMAILSALLGTPWQPRLDGHVLMLEEVSEYIYRIDRFLFHITSNPGVRCAAGIRLGRCSDIPANDPDFGRDEEAITREWCARAGLAYLGRADIGHDAGNKVVPFGDRWRQR